MNQNGPCFAHFQLNCKICFPNQSQAPGGNTSNATPGQTSGGNVNSTPSASSASPNGLLQDPTENEASNKRGSDLDPDDTEQREKRKAHLLKYRYPSKKKKALIDCPVAQSVFRGLRLTNKFFNSGSLLAWGVPPDEPVYKYINDYVANGQMHGHGIKILSVVRIIVNASSIERGDAPADFNEDTETKGKFRKMLWHGTKRRVVSSILQDGLRLPTTRGQMFGQGIYFADQISKSVQYCNGFIWEGATAFVFLCDVLLGRIFKSENPMHFITSPPNSTATGLRSCFFGTPNDSVMGCGRCVPDPAGDIEIDGSVWPLGKAIPSAEDRRHLLLRFNEYVVYETAQVIPKYLLKVMLTEEPYFEKIE